jgi:replicative DNA helicase
VSKTIDAAAFRSKGRNGHRQEEPPPATPDDQQEKRPRVEVTRAVDLVPRIREQSRRPKLSTGFDRLDAMVNGFRARTVTALVAGVGQGKTSFALQVAARHAESSPVVYVGLELTREQLVTRIIGQRTGTAWHKVADGELSDAEMAAVLEPLALYLPARADDPPAAVHAGYEIATSRHAGLPLLVIDYVQLLAKVGTDMRLATMDAVRQVLLLTEETDLVTWVLSQGSRTSAKLMRDGGGKAAEDFVAVGAETAAIEASAANELVFAFRKKDGEAEHQVTVHVAKARMGQTGRLGYRFHGPTGRWTEMERPPLTEKQEERREQIRNSLRNVSGGPLSRNTIRERDGKKWVDGNKSDVLKEIDAMLKEGQLREAGGGIWIV